MLFDAAEPALRTLKYCADYNNGVTGEGKPDLKLVTRLSTMPDRTTCAPVACTTGKAGAPCKGADDDVTCDSAPGAADGSCDACTITAGRTEADSSARPALLPRACASCPACRVCRDHAGTRPRMRVKDEDAHATRGDPRLTRPSSRD